MSRADYFIRLFPRSDVRDAAGEQVRQKALRHHGIETGKVACGKLYGVRAFVQADDIIRFAQLGLADPITHDCAIFEGQRRLDRSNDEGFAPGFGSFILVGKRPGVTDDEGLTAQVSFSDILGVGGPEDEQWLYVSELVLLERLLGPQELALLAEEALGNPLINHFEWGHLPGYPHYYPRLEAGTPEMTRVVDIFVDDQRLLTLSREMVLSLDLPEMHAIQSYYQLPETVERRRGLDLPRLPTDCELEILAQTWSEHCKHKEFNALIDFLDSDTGESFVIDSLFNTYIRGATEAVQRDLERAGDHWLVKVFTDNAGVVRIDDERVFVWKVETHNTPSALDPYGGAITGIVGNNRDPLGTGRGGGRLLFNTNVLCFGPLDYDQPLLTGQLHPRRVFEGVRHGIEDGGNKSGIPTVNGSIIFDERYAGKPLVYCGTGSIMPSSYKGKNSWVKEIDAGDRIVMAGGRVGKDGIHGATFSSTEIDKNSPRTAVQIGSPITQKLMSDFLEEACSSGLVKCSTDNGAGGLSSSVGELATLSGGARVRLDRVPLKYAGLEPWEIFVSESQERMTLVVEPPKWEPLLSLATLYEVELSDIGEFTDTGFLEVNYGEIRCAYLELDFLHDGAPRKKMAAVWEKPTAEEPSADAVVERSHADETGFTHALVELVGSSNICSRESVIRQYDHEVKGKTIVKPLMGRTGKAPQDAAVMRLSHDGWRGIAISNGICPKYSDLDAYEMSAGAFDEAVRQIISVGGRLPAPGEGGNNFWTVNDNFCVPDSAYHPQSNPDGKYKLAQLVRMCQALFDMSTFFSIPMTSGKDSMKNDFRADGRKISVPPTILYSMVASVDDVRKVVTSDFKVDGDLVYLLGRTRDELGGSEFYRLRGHLGANVPVVDRDNARAVYLAMMRAHSSQLLQSSHDLSDGGLAVALAECCFGRDCGVQVKLPPGELSPQAWLFSESHSRFVVSVRPDHRLAFEAASAGHSLMIGRVTSQCHLEIAVGDDTLVSAPTAALMRAWDGGLE